MILHKIFYVPIFTFRFDKHETYDFSDIARQGRIDSRPKGWTTSVNSTYPFITDNDRLVSPDVSSQIPQYPVTQSAAHRHIHLSTSQLYLKIASADITD